MELFGQSRSWQVPPAAVSEDYKLGWLNEAVEEGQNWLGAQRGANDWRKAMDVLAGKSDTTEILAYRSKLSTNRLKRNIREVVGALANVRPIWGFHSDNEAFSANAEMMNKVSRAVYLSQFFDRSLKEALQYAAATCTGWVRPCYRRSQGGRGKGNIQLLTYGAPCVLPVQLPANNDWQEAYAVTLLDELPIYMAHSYFPEHQDRLRPTASKYWYSADIRKAASGNIWKRMFGGMKRESNQTDLYIPIRYTNVIDLTLNRTGSVIPMGEPGSSWYYEVPSLGQELPAGKDSHGNQLVRKANENDARLYPFRRLIISSQNCICYDGPGFNWHGDLDLIPFCVDDWAWEPLGFSLVKDGYDLQEAATEIERGTMNKIRAQLDLPLGYDINAVSKREAEEFDPMQPRARIGYDGSQVDKPFSPVVPPEVYAIRPEVGQYLEHLYEAMDYQLAVRDIVALGKAKAFGKGMDESQLEALSAGPIVKDISRSMERSLARIGSQMKYLILQFMDTRKLMQLVGEDGVTQEIFDFNPSSLIPSHMPGENPQSPTGSIVSSSFSNLERAKWFADNLQFFVLPHSVHEITQVSNQLKLLQLRMRNLPIDSRTILEAFNVPNIGNSPAGNTVQERYRNEKEEEVLFALRIKQMVEQLGIGDILNQLQAGSGAPGGSRKGTGGRPATAQSSPTQKVKGDGRPIVSESN